MDRARYFLLGGPVVMVVAQQLPDTPRWRPVKAVGLLAGGAATVWAAWKTYVKGAEWAS